MPGLTFTYEVDGNDYQKAGEASRSAKFTLKKLGLPPEVVRRVGICMYEGEINMVIHADGGTATLTVGMDEIEIALEDKGPGIPDLELAMQEGWSTADSQANELGFGAGMGGARQGGFGGGAAGGFGGQGMRQRRGAAGAAGTTPAATTRPGSGANAQYDSGASNIRPFDDEDLFVED